LGSFGNTAARALAIAMTLLLLACGGTTESVSRDVCLSGTRWIGENTSDPEMSPGSDCVGCHEENDGPPLVAAGTVYGAANNTSQIENDCFGLEGVEVELEGADGTILSTTTNRAGNFYFDGYPIDLPKPYVARLRYTTEDGRLISPQMIVTQPYYGGCARCHDNRQPTTVDLDISDPEFVRPVEGLFVQ
jgi:hypothetical protein